MSDLQLLLFVMTSLLVILSPGQDMVLVMSRGMSQGVKAGMVTAVGVSVGLLGHTLLAAMGVGALLLASDTLFTVVKVIGATYLIYLGIRLVVSKSPMEKLQATNKSYKKMFSEGAISNITNPKVTLFYFAFLPQFISSDIPNPTGYLLLLGVGFSLLTLLIKAPIGYFSGRVSNWIATRPVVLHTINRVSGSVLIGLGLKLVFEER